MSQLLTLVLALLLSACGGSGGAGAGTPGTDKLGTGRPGLYGYYFGCSTYAVEQAGHANLWWATATCGAGNWATQVASSLLAARAAGGFVCAVLHLPDKQAYAGAAAVADLGAQLRQLASTKLLDGWPCLALYPADEPDRFGLTDEQVKEGNAALRSEMDGIPQLRGRPLAVFYACSTGQTPGFESFDWIGCDDYQRHCAVTAVWDNYIARMAGDQVFMPISGGYAATKQDPTCLRNWASNQPRAKVFIAYLWQNDGHDAGIRDDPTLRVQYNALGDWVLGGT